jgi:CBS domain containing-hemolysin-like protein
LDEDILTSLLYVGLLILLHATVQFAYSTLTNCRWTALNEKNEAGDKSARRTLRLIENLPQLYVTTHILLTTFRVAIITLTVIGVAQPLMDAADQPEWMTPLAVYLLVLIPAGVVLYIAGDLIPSTWGRAVADEWAPSTTMIMGAFVMLLKPLVIVLMGVQTLLSRVSGGEALEKHVTEEEIIAMVDVGQRGGSIEHDEKEMIYSVLQFNEIAVREIMIPRPDVSAIEIDDNVQAALKLIVESGHSRIPVYDDEIDNVKGMLYAKDLLNTVYQGTFGQRGIRDLMRPVHFVPDSKRADDLFKEMQVNNIHIAVVVDEYGSTAGLVTIEDLVEEIVGDIKDEYDQNEEAEFVQLTPDTYLVDGAMQLGDLNDQLGVALSTEANDTLGGYIYNETGEVPKVGQTIEAGHLIMRIEKVDNRRILKVLITRVLPPADPKRDSSEQERPEKLATSEREVNGGSADKQVRTVFRHLG